MFKFEQFEGWQRAMVFGRALIKMTWKFPTSYQSWLGDQLRRAALSISTNLAEGSGRDMTPDKGWHMMVAGGGTYGGHAIATRIPKRCAVSTMKPTVSQVLFPLQ